MEPVLGDLALFAEVGTGALVSPRPHPTRTSVKEERPLLRRRPQIEICVVPVRIVSVHSFSCTFVVRKRALKFESFFSDLRGDGVERPEI